MEPAEAKTAIVSATGNGVISIFKKRSGAHESTIREQQMHPGRIMIGQLLKAFQGVLTGVPHYIAAKNSKLITLNAE